MCTEATAPPFAKAGRAWAPYEATWRPFQFVQTLWSWSYAFLRSWSSGEVSRRADRNDGVVGWNCSLAFRNFRDNCLIYQMQGSGCTPIVPGHIVTWATQPTHDARQLSNSFCAFWVRLRVPIDRFSETRTLDVHVVSRP